MGNYNYDTGPQDHEAAAELAAQWEHDLPGAYRHFLMLVPMTWVQNEANQILKRKYRSYWQIWEDEWNKIVEETRQKSREYEKWFHRNDKWHKDINDEQN